MTSVPSREAHGFTESSRSGRSRFVLFASLLALAACGGAPRGGGEVTVRDSAGVRIVENPAPRGDAPEWRLDRREWVLGTELDGDDVEHVRLYRLVQP
jgi:hypothetical protein